MAAEILCEEGVAGSRDVALSTRRGGPGHRSPSAEIGAGPGSAVGDDRQRATEPRCEGRLFGSRDGPESDRHATAGLVFLTRLLAAGALAMLGAPDRQQAISRGVDRRSQQKPRGGRGQAGNLERLLHQLE